MIASLALNLCLSFSPALPPAAITAPEAVEMESSNFGGRRNRWRRYHRRWRHRNHRHHHGRHCRHGHGNGNPGGNPTPEPISLSFAALAGLGFLARKKKRNFLDFQD
jgi:hypothetical protein